MLLFASVNVLTQAKSREGFHLLKLLRSYLELDLFSSLTVQTDITLEAGWAELMRFESLLRVWHFELDSDPYCAISLSLSWQEYRQLNPLKSWDFPKAHSHQHMFHDIRMKGVTRNYNTKPSEKMNGILKKFYRNHTNFKDVAPQVCYHQCF